MTFIGRQTPVVTALRGRPLFLPSSRGGHSRCLHFLSPAAADTAAPARQVRRRRRTTTKSRPRTGRLDSVPPMYLRRGRRTFKQKPNLQRLLSLIFIVSERPAAHSGRRRVRRTPAPPSFPCAADGPQQTDSNRCCSFKVSLSAPPTSLSCAASHSPTPLRRRRGL